MYISLKLKSIFILGLFLLNPGVSLAVEHSPKTVGLKTVYYSETANQTPLIGNIYYPVDKEVKGKPVEGPASLAMQAIGAPVKASKNPYPLIILSHGYGGTRDSLAWLAQSLTGAGYMVAAIDHFGNTASFDAPKLALQRWLRPRDISAFLDNLLKDPELAPLIDTNRIGFAGYSLGGLTGIWLAGGIADQFTKPTVGKSPIYELARNATQKDVDSIDYEQSHKSYKDPRIKAAFLMAPAHGQSFSTNGLKNINIPVFIVVGENDKLTPPAQHAGHFAKSIPGAGYEVFKGNVSHLVFQNQIQPDKIKCVSHFEYEVDPSVDVKALHEKTAQLAIDFFNKALK